MGPRTIGCIAAATLFVCSAGMVRAADLPAAPVYKAPAAAVAAYNWSGFYAGINAGGGLAAADFLDPDCNLCSDTKFQTAFGTAGAQLGYNWQWRSAVLGLEADADWLSVNASKPFGLEANSLGASVSFKLDSVASIRARMGLAVDNTLIFVTAGPAFGYFDSVTHLGALAGVPITATDKAWHPGIAAGGGVEVMLTDTVSLRGEYLYFMFTSADNAAVPATVSCTPGPCRMTNAYSVQEARVGLDFKLGN